MVFYFMEELPLAGCLFDLGKTSKEVHTEFQNRDFGVPEEVLKAYKICYETGSTTEDDFIEALYKVYIQNPGPFEDFNEYLYYLGDPNFTEIYTSEKLSEISIENPFFFAESLKRKDYEFNTKKAQSDSGNIIYYSYRPRTIEDIMKQDLIRQKISSYYKRGVELLEELGKL